MENIFFCEIHLYISVGTFCQPFSYCSFLCAFNLAEYFLNKCKKYLQLAGVVFNRHLWAMFKNQDFKKQPPSCSVKKVLLKTSKKSQENAAVKQPYLKFGNFSVQTSRRRTPLCPVSVHFRKVPLYITFIFIEVDFCQSMCLWVRLCVYNCVYMRVCVFMCTCEYVCVCVHARVCVFSSFSSVAMKLKTLLKSIF